ncbi:hypothetical protein [Desulfatirhabdium butyrativorans]|uniref:hypothetical protein n=1 Tax=Desulfatirhabdium butyrativorans TaxID=340467 RepID=UPI0012ECA3B2|nr:hypothetical protein [Desulfatirhabdium butyrativorans]
MIAAVRRLSLSLISSSYRAESLGISDRGNRNSITYLPLPMYEFRSPALRGIIAQRRWNDGLGLRMVATKMQSRENEWHRRKQREHCQIGRTGDWISARDTFAKRPILEGHGEQER